MGNPTAIRKHVISMLQDLSASLTYHNIAHTLDVAAQCMTIAKEEKVINDQALLELEIAALFHDTGLLYVYEGHEEISCKLANEQLPGFGINKKSIANICEIIMATKVPQQPKNHLQEIICDADLDYLGRDDYFILNDKLRNEFIDHGISCNEKEWEESRIAFLKSHSYFTQSSKSRRDAKKLLHLKKITGENALNE